MRLACHQLREWRRKTGTSYRSLAERLKCSYQTVFLWEHGSHLPSVVHALALQNIANIDVEAWVTERVVGESVVTDRVHGAFADIEDASPRKA